MSLSGEPETLWRLAILAIVALAAGLSRGFSGFGAALIFVPLASTIVGPHVAAPLLLVIDGITTLGLIPPATRIADRRDVGTMTIGALFGVPLGVYLLNQLDPLTIRWSIVVMVGLMLLLLVSGWRYHGRPRPALTIGVGAAAGLLTGAAQVGGPPVVAYWLGGVIPAATVRANIIVYFAISSVLTATGYIWTGLVTIEVLILAAIVGPAFGLGVWVGTRMFGVASDETFRRICYGMIAVATVLSMPLLDTFRR